MSEPLLKPRAAYEGAVQDRANIGERSARLLFEELQQHQAELDDHEFSVERSGNVVEVKRGSLEIVRAVFNYADSGRHRISNGVAEALRRGLAVDFDDPGVAIYEFKVQLRLATDLFYANRAQFSALGLA